MRSTLHLVTGRDALALRPVVQSVLQRTWNGSGFAKQLAGVDVDEVVAAGLEAPGRTDLSGAELKRLLAARWPDHDATALAYAVRFLVPLVHLPPRGIWAEGARPPAPARRLSRRARRRHAPPDDTILRYLAAFGPATTATSRPGRGSPASARPSTGCGRGCARSRTSAGRELLDVPDGPLPDPDTPAPVRFLPWFDNAFLSHKDRSRIIPPEHGHLNIGVIGRPVVLVDGSCGRSGRSGTASWGSSRSSRWIWTRLRDEGSRLLAFAATPV